MTIKVLITGSSGILGRVVHDKFIESKEFETYGLVFSRNKGKNKVICDLTCDKSTLEVLDSINPNIVIHCAAERRPDVVNQNKEKATRLNVGSIETITRWCNANNSHVIFISSDYVFDGISPPYKEDDGVSPINDYGALKVQAEQIVLAPPGNNVVLRLPVLYGSIEFVEETAVTVLFAKVKDNSKKAPMSNFERRFPTHCNDVAQTIFNMVTHWLLEKKDLSGIYHYQAEEEMTKFEMATKMAHIFSLPSGHIVIEDPPDGNETTKRPYKSQMSCERLKALGLYHLPMQFEDGIRSCLLPFVK